MQEATDAGGVDDETSVSQCGRQFMKRYFGIPLDLAQDESTMLPVNQMIDDRPSCRVFGLTLHPDKTRLVDFRPRRTESTRHPETDGTKFDFLGLTHVWGRSRRGKDMVMQVMAKSRFARALAAVSDWCRKHRNWSIRDQHRHLSSMMRGHFAYYGVGGNARRLRWFAHQVARIWQKWLSRRDRQSVFRWTRLNEILKRHPLPPARLLHSFATVSETLR